MKKWFLLLLICIPSLGLCATPLPAEDVFQVQVKKIDPNTFLLDWHIKPEYFLYRDRIQLKPVGDSTIQLGTARFPASSQKMDKQGKTYRIYRNQLELPVAVLGTKPGQTLLNLHYQGCSDDGFCYPPEMKQITLTIDDNLGLSASTFEKTIALAPLASTPKADDEISNIFTTHNWAMILFIFFGLGLLLSFTPCVLPMIPVLSGIIVGHGKTVTTRKAFFLSLSYVLSMSATYAVFGAVAAVLGANLQISMQSPWAIGIFSFIFILLALSMFGFYEFRLPQSWQSKISGSSQSQRGGHYIGAAIMGCLSSLILSPCVTAPLIGVLSYIAQTKNVLLGSLTLFFLSLGMGTPLLLIGTSAGKWLPRTGSWMNAVKAFFGVLLIAVAIYLTSRILPEALTMILWASLLVFSGVYSGALSQSITNQQKFMQSIGIMILSYGILILIGVGMGSTNPLHPLTAVYAERSLPKPVVMEHQNLASIKQSLAKAREKQIPVMLDFYADWCASCKVMEATTFKDAAVKDRLEHFKVIKIDVTENNADNKAIMNHYHVIAPPTFIFFNSEGKELRDLKSFGEIDAGKFLGILEQVG